MGSDSLISPRDNELHVMKTAKRGSAGTESKYWSISELDYKATANTAERYSCLR